MKILLIEDDHMISDAIVRFIRKTELAIDAVHSLADAQLAVQTHDFELLVLDLNLPDGDGLSFLKSIRMQKNEIPVLILTARDEPKQRVAGLDLGADDYLAKPFDMDELVARIRALLRRRTGRTAPKIHYGDLVLEPQKMEARLAGAPVAIPISQLRLLQYLIEAEGRVKTKQQIIETLYSWDDTVAENTIEVYVSQLRKLLWPEVIKTIRGIGYSAPSLQS